MDDEFHRMMYLADPQLRQPVMIVGMEGWIDAGLGASSAMSSLLDSIDTEIVVTFDTDYFIDQRARRPMVRIVDGVTTELTWAEILVRHGTDRDGADVLLLSGPEPDFHWSDFTELVTDLADHFGVRLVIGLGAFPAPTPHTRPVRIIGTAPESSRYLLEPVSSVEGELEVPAGIISAVEMAFGETDIPMITLWARVPHYVASMPYPQAAVAILDSLAAVSGLSIDAAPLREAADEARQRVNDLITNNPEHEMMVRTLEASADETEGTSLGDELPSGDELAAELEKFLRGEAGA